MDFIIPILAALAPTLCIQLFALISARRGEKKRIDKLEGEINMLMQKVTRVEILSLCALENSGADLCYLMELYDFYKSRGGNSYIDIIVAKKIQDHNTINSSPYREENKQ